MIPGLLLPLLFAGCGGNATSTSSGAPTVSISASPASITTGSSSTLTVTATNATQEKVSGTDGITYTVTLTAGVGTQVVSPIATTTYTVAGAGGSASASATVTVTSTSNLAPTVTISASPASITAGGSSTLTVVATNATQVTVTGDGSTYTLAVGGGTQSVSPAATTTYTVTATGAGGSATATATVTVGTTGTEGVKSINHVIFMLQENHTFDNYFGMLNPYRQKNNMDVGDDGVTYNVDGIDDKLTTTSYENEDDEDKFFPFFKLTSTCVDDMTSDWLASFGDVNRYIRSTTRPILMDGFVHNAEGYAKSCVAGTGDTCSGAFSAQSLTGEPAMGYYDEGFLNYYYYMASQFAVSDRWFSPVATKSIGNRIATFTGGTTQGLVKDPGGDDGLSQLNISNIFEALNKAGVSWRVYYTVNQGFCLNEDDCNVSKNLEYPATDFSNLTYSYQYLQDNPTPGDAAGCKAPLQGSSVVQDPTGDSFCIDLNHIAPIGTYFTDLKNGTLPSFAFIEPGYGANDEHPGSGNSILLGQAQVASVVNAFMASNYWNDSVFFFSYDEGGGPYDHVPPVPGHSNDYTYTTTLGAVPPDIGSIAVKPDGFNPCLPPTPGKPTLNCDLDSSDPGANSGDAAAVNGFAAQLGFRLPNIIISPFTRKHYVSHTPMDHTAVLKFVEDRFIGNHVYLTARDAAQPNLLEFFDFNGIPWAKAPTPPTPLAPPGNCNAANVGP
jgi:phospholipase C